MSDFREALYARFADKVSFSEALRAQHGEDTSFHHRAIPDAVLFAHSTEDVQSAIALCSEAGKPVIPYGAGSSLEGHIIPSKGGLTINVSKMDTILEISAIDLDCRVQAGVTREQLNSALRDQGLFFPVDPGANATIGGMAATGASGTTTVHYGAMRDMVRGLSVVLPDGSLIQTGGRARKSSAGYDLTRLFIGSEGTLGIIMEVQLALVGIPDSILAGVTHFPTMQQAVEAVTYILQAGIPVARIELLDDVQIKAINRYTHTELPEFPTLFLEFHGSEGSLQDSVSFATDMISGCAGSEIQWARAQEDRNRLWKARHDALWAAKALRPGAEALITDVCVPISYLAENVVAARADIDARGLMGTIVGHVGDGNFHVVLMIDPHSEEEIDRAEHFNDNLINRALACGGTCTGEHGIGLGKKAALRREHGDCLPLMRAIKSAIDPRGLFNPGKIFD